MGERKDVRSSVCVTAHGFSVVTGLKPKTVCFFHGVLQVVVVIRVQMVVLCLHSSRECHMLRALRDLPSGLLNRQLMFLEKGLFLRVPGDVTDHEISRYVVFVLGWSSPGESAVVTWSRTDASRAGRGRCSSSVSAWVMFHRCLVFGSSAQALCHSAHSRHTGATFAWWRASFGTVPQRFHASESTTAHGQSATHTARTHTHTKVHRVQLVNGQPGQQPARRSKSLQRWEATKDPRIVMHLPVQSDGAVDLSSVPLRPPSIPGATVNVAPGSRVPAPSAQKIKRQLSLAEICPAVRQ